MHTAAKLARFGDRMVSIFAAALILLMLLYGGYSLWDTAMVFQGAFLDSDLLQFKPAAGDPDDNPTLQELQAINPDVCGWLTIDTWLAVTSVVFAWIVFAIARSRSGLIIRSFLLTTYQSIRKADCNP